MSKSKTVSHKVTDKEARRNLSVAADAAMEGELNISLEILKDETNRRIRERFKKNEES